MAQNEHEQLIEAQKAEINYFSTLALVAKKLGIPTGSSVEEQVNMVKQIQEWACKL